VAYPGDDVGSRCDSLVFGNKIELPVRLDQPAPRLRAYSHETVTAEKFQTMVMLGRPYQVDQGRSGVKTGGDLGFTTLSRALTREPACRGV
jgi:hypothetical protein